MFGCMYHQRESDPRKRDTKINLTLLQVLNLSSNALPTLRREKSCIAQQLLIVDVSRNQLVSIE